MKKDYCALSFSEKERNCERTFEENGPYWHLYTDGTQMQDIFCSEEEFRTGMWTLAGAAHQQKDVRILTFQIMNNHLHKIFAGREESGIEMFERLETRLRRLFSKTGRAIDWSRFKMEILPINDLKALRNEIIYTNRNAFVANGAYTPDSYPWGGGCAYFNAWTEHLRTSRVGDMKVATQRELLHLRDVAPFADLREIDMMPFVPSFCDIRLGENMFRDARSYFNSLTRNAEAYSQIAARLKDSVFLTDEELFTVMSTYIYKEYSTKSAAQLNGEQKIAVARHLRFGYNASNQQLRRLLRLEPAILEELFPQG
jgi:REP element-mobilizing transposase RayT